MFDSNNILNGMTLQENDMLGKMEICYGHLGLALRGSKKFLITSRYSIEVSLRKGRRYPFQNQNLFIVMVLVLRQVKGIKDHVESVLADFMTF